MTAYQFFLDYVERQMVFHQPSSEKLIRLLEDELSKLNTSEDKALLLNGVLKLRHTRNIDRAYIGTLMPFFDYAEYRYGSEKAVINYIDWSWLYERLLDRYIEDVSLGDFAFVMTHRVLPRGKKAIQWSDQKTDAIIFCEHFKFPLSAFNRCFRFPDGKELKTHHKSRNNPDPVFMKLIQNP